MQCPALLQWEPVVDQSAEERTQGIRHRACGGHCGAEDEAHRAKRAELGGHQRHWQTVDVQSSRRGCPRETFLVRQRKLQNCLMSVFSDPKEPMEWAVNQATPTFEVDMDDAQGEHVDKIALRIRIFLLKTNVCKMQR